MSEPAPKYADLILPLAVPQYYTYRVPEHLSTGLAAGFRVNVVLGKRRIYTAIVRKLHTQRPEGFDVHEIIDVLDEAPLVSESQMLFWEWIADYYMCTVGEVYRAAVPSGLKLESETRIFPEELTEEPEGLQPAEMVALDILLHSPGISIRKLATSLSKKNVLPLVKKLVEKKVVSLEENLRENYKPKTKDYVVLASQFHSEERLNEIISILDKRAAKQAKLLLAFVERLSAEEIDFKKIISKEELLAAAQVSYAVLTGLAKKGVVEIVPIEVSRLEEHDLEPRPPHPLNKSQNAAYKKITGAFKEKDVCLLHGVTSSGKTEIYIHLIAAQLEQGKQVLYLLPEIALTTQIIQRLRSVFGDRVGVYHSKFSDAERVEVYQNLVGIKKQGSPSYDIILGVRSSLFLPFKNLGMIIVDEEHESTYKQFDPAPRYNARDASVVLANMHKAKVLMGTATPAFETYLNALNKRYGLVELFERYKDIQLPEIQVVNVREARRKKRMNSHFSPQLIEYIETTLANHEQVILFQNRRGYAPYIECFDCGWIPYCKHCDVSLTYHKKSNKLHCHYCGYAIHHPANCDSCGINKIATRGFGTEKVEDEISLLFPKAKVARMDMDTTRTRRAYERIIENFELRKVDILIGTQMISKGLDFDHVKVVGILNADNMLNFPDFRSFEKAFQLIAQVSGRAGRKNTRGTVVIQTSDPKNTVIRHVINNNYKEFFQQQMQERRQFKYPPYFRLVKLMLRHRKLPVVSKASRTLAAELRSKMGDRVVGPEFPLINRLFNMHQKVIIVKIERDKHFSERRTTMRNAIDKILVIDEFKGVQIVADVDPYN